ncbi:MAG: hypothetical protein JXK93_00990 [Sphaerochaetaceae bacterium]|nr:hypothetical protein [Sphaerochaetaceae bacterium]
METYVATRDCFFEGMHLKRGQTIKLAKGTKVTFKLLKKVDAPEAPKK